MFDRELILYEDGIEVPVTLQTMGKVSVEEALFIARIMFSAVEWWRNYQS